MKIGKRSLKMSSGKVRTFKSGQARERFEKVARVVKHSPAFKKKLRKKR